MNTYEVTIKGVAPLLMHWDNIDWADTLDAWKADAKNKKNSRAGDDRTPAWRWLGCVYHDGARVGMPSENLMRCFMEGGAMVPVPGAKGNKTFKSQTQSGMNVTALQWDVLVEGKAVPWSAIEALRKVEDFAAHKQAVGNLGFSLFVKRAKIGATKHIRVRPRFNEWTLRGTVAVWDEQITRPVLQEIMSYAGRYKGLGDWRPGGRTPGSFGMFEATVS